MRQERRTAGDRALLARHFSGWFARPVLPLQGSVRAAATGSRGLNSRALAIILALVTGAGIVAASSRAASSPLHSVSSPASSPASAAAAAKLAGRYAGLTRAASSLDATTTTLTGSPNPATEGQTVTLTAMVTSSNGTPTGLVTFMDGTTALGPGQVVINGSASFTTASLSAGQHSLTAVYSPEAGTNFAGSTSTPFSLAVNAAVRTPTTTTLTVTPNPANPDQAVTVSATVTGAGGTPTGTFTLMDGSMMISELAVAGGQGQENFGGGFSSGTHALTVVYSGDTAFAPSTSPVVNLVVSQRSTTTLTVSPNPVAAGQPVTLTAMVTSSTSSSPLTGTITFMNELTPIGSPVPLVNGQATLMTSALTGEPTLTAVYSGDSTFFGSTSKPVLLVVNGGSVTPPSPFVVINTNDGGPGSLRQVLMNVNGQTSATPVTVTFNIPTSDPGFNSATNSWTISPLTQLPAVTQPVIIDGYSQPGSSKNTNGPGLGDNAKLTIELNGSLLTASQLNPSGFQTSTPVTALEISGGNSTVQGLVINRFGVFLATINGVVAGTVSGTDVLLDTSGGDTVQGCFIGTDVTGTMGFIGGGQGSFLSNGAGIEVQGTSGNTIGGTAPASRNVISGSLEGADIEGGANTTVQGNFIGVDATGMKGIGNGRNGIVLAPAALTRAAAAPANNLVGGTAAGAGNVISLNGFSPDELTGAIPGDGISVDVDGTTIQGNLIGTDVTGTANLGNGTGIAVFSSSNTIGGTIPGAGNVIAFSSFFDGVEIDSGVGNAVEGNSIFSNTPLGIDLVGGSEDSNRVTQNTPGGPHTGPNDLQNFPILSTVTVSGSSTTITGSLNSTPATMFRVEFFSNPAADPSGFGQGKTFLGFTNITTDGSGNASFTFTAPTAVPAGQAISSTATDPGGNTSEFSKDIGLAVLTATTTTLTASPNPATAGQPVTLTAAVSGTGGTPTGTVTFMDGTTALGTAVTLINGSATTMTSSLAVGSHSLTAVYSGDATFAGSTSPAVMETINPSFVVTNTLDSGAGSLRQVLTDVNAQAGTAPITVTFNIPNTDAGFNAATNSWTIIPQSDLPTITHPVVIDGYSQPGSSPNTNGPGMADSAKLTIEIDGAADTAASAASTGTSVEGLHISAGNSTVQGLVINRFGDISPPNNGFMTPGDCILLDASGSDVVRGCFLGIDVTGTMPFTEAAGTRFVSDGDGIVIVGTSGNLVGGTTPDARNIITGTLDAGIGIAGANNTIEGNFIGVDASGTKAPGNGVFGIDIDVPEFLRAGATFGSTNTDASGLTGNIIGGPTAAASNLIGGNGAQVGTAGPSAPGAPSGSISIAGSSTVIQGNFIGTDSTGTLNLGNAGPVLLFSSSNTVGGTTGGDGNVIAFNVGGGVVVAGGMGNAIEGNSIFSNIPGFGQVEGSQLGINLAAPNDPANGVTPNAPGGPHTGPNDLQNYPVLSSATAAGGATIIAGSLNSTPATVFRVEFFSNPTADPSSFGQGKTFLGSVNVSTDAGGNASFTFSAPTAVPLGQVISSTATDPNGDTSEFSQDITVRQPALTPTTTTLMASPSPSSPGQPVTLTAAVAGTGGTPTGTVTFMDGTTALGNAVTLTNGSASLTTSSLAVGSHNLTAVYSGDTTFAGSSSPAVPFTVNSAQVPAIQVSSNFPSTPGTVGQNLVDTITVSNTGNADATGATLAVALPSSVTFVSANPAPATVNGSTLNFSLPTIPAGQSSTITVTVTPQIAGTIMVNSTAQAQGANPVSSPAMTTVNPGVTTLFTFPTGLSLVSLPFDYSATMTDAATLLGLTALSNGVTPLATANPATATYLLYPNLPDVNGQVLMGKQTIPGRGYWIFENASTPFTSSQAGAAVSSPFETTLQGGWNQVGDPFTVPLDTTQAGTLLFSVPFALGTNAPNQMITLQQAMTLNLVRTQFFAYDNANNRYLAATTLQPFLGYWVYIDPVVSMGTPVTVQFVAPALD